MIINFNDFNDFLSRNKIDLNIKIEILNTLNNIEGYAYLIPDNYYGSISFSYNEKYSIGLYIENDIVFGISWKEMERILKSKNVIFDFEIDSYDKNIEILKKSYKIQFFFKQWVLNFFNIYLDEKLMKQYIKDLINNEIFPNNDEGEINSQIKDNSVNIEESIDKIEKKDQEILIENQFDSNKNSKIKSLIDLEDNNDKNETFNFNID